MIITATLPLPAANRLRKVMEARKVHPDTCHLIAKPGDIMRELIGEWVNQQWAEMELGRAELEGQFDA